MQKILPLKTDNTEDKIDIICRLICITAKPEITVIKAIYSINNGGPCTLDIEDRKLICFKSNTNPSTFNVSLSRLIAKGVVMQVGLTYKLHDVFRDIDKCTSLQISF